MTDKLAWALVLGIIGGFAFAVGTAVFEKTGKRFGLGDSAAGSAVGSPT
jgi:hypothetical protein